MLVNRSLSSWSLKFLLALGVVILCAGLAKWSINSHKTPPVLHGAYLEEPRSLPNFSLVGINEQPFTNVSLKGHWTMLFFGFTHCGSICPVTMAKLAKFVDILAENHVSPVPKITFISLDPENDSLQRLASYVHSYNPNFFAATGSAREIDALTKALGVAVIEATENQPIEHSGTLMLLNPEAKLIAFFTPPHSVQDLASDYKALLSLK